jgi:hypothetical protein
LPSTRPQCVKNAPSELVDVGASSSASASASASASPSASLEQVWHSHDFIVTEGEFHDLGSARDQRDGLFTHDCMASGARRTGDRAGYYSDGSTQAQGEARGVEGSGATARFDHHRCRSQCGN